MRIRDFVLQEVCVHLHDDARVYNAIQRDIERLFASSISAIDACASLQKDDRDVLIDAPQFSNDYVALAYVVSNRMRGSKRVLARVPFVALGEDISAIIYSNLSGGTRVMSSDNL